MVIFSLCDNEREEKKEVQRVSEREKAGESRENTDGARLERNSTRSGRVCSGYRSITDIRLGHERNKPICIICPAGINSPLKVATNEVIHWMNVGVEGERDRKRKIDARKKERK